MSAEQTTIHLKGPAKRAITELNKEYNTTAAYPFNSAKEGEVYAALKPLYDTHRCDQISKKNFNQNKRRHLQKILEKFKDLKLEVNSFEKRFGESPLEKEDSTIMKFFR